MFACKFSSVLMKFLISYTLQGARNAPNRVTMPRASDPNRCRRAELVPESPPRAARRAASARGPAPKTPAAAPAAATPAGSLTRVHCDDSRLEIFRAYSAWIVKGKPRRESPMPIRFLHDRAPAYQGVAKDKAVQEAFDGGVEIAAGKAPDMSHLDAGVCKVMENAVEKEGAQTPDEIRKVVQKVWKAKITPDYCLKISKHIRKNMLAVVARKGGNFYKD